MDIEIEKVGAEARKTGHASTRHPLSRHFMGFHFGDQEYTITLASNRATYQFLGAPVAVIPRCINQTHPERYACAQRFFLGRFRMPPLAQTGRTLTDHRDNGAVPQLRCAWWSVRCKNRRT